MNLNELKKKLLKRVDSLQEELEEVKLLIALIENELRRYGNVIVLKYKNVGEEIGKIYVSEKMLKVVPKIKFNEEIPPFKSFLITRILEGKHIQYQIVKDKENNVDMIVINIDTNDKKTVDEITKSVKWTLERIKERIDAESKR